jgi:hypothetical protein
VPFTALNRRQQQNHCCSSQGRRRITQVQRIRMRPPVRLWGVWTHRGNLLRPTYAARHTSLGHDTSAATQERRRSRQSSRCFAGSRTAPSEQLSPPSRRGVVGKPGCGPATRTTDESSTKNHSLHSANNRAANHGYTIKAGKERQAIRICHLLITATCKHTRGPVGTESSLILSLTLSKEKRKTSQQLDSSQRQPASLAPDRRPVQRQIKGLNHRTVVDW